jgi:hypothetical protein
VEQAVRGDIDPAAPPSARLRVLEDPHLLEALCIASCGQRQSKDGQHP